MIAFSDNEIEKRKLHRLRNLILLKDVDIKKIQVLSKVSSGKKHYKHFIGYKDNDHKVKPLRIVLPKTSTYDECLCKKL